jgi:leucyl aminopeptidase
VTNLRLASPQSAALDVDAVVIGVVTTDSGPGPAPGAERVDEAFDGALTEALTAMGASGKPGEVTKLPTLGRLDTPLVVAVGLGATYDSETLRRAAGVAVRSLVGRTGVVLALPATSADEVAAVTTGALLGNYSFLTYRTGEEKQPVAELTIISELAADETLHRSQVIAEAVALVRDLVNTAPSDLHPAEFAKIAERVAQETGLEVEVLEEKALCEAGYGGIVGVGQGSVNPPRLVRLAYRHPEATRTVAFVGKGITFDSGGLSLKPAESMDWMKSDMGGAAAVLGSLQAIALLKPQVNVIGYLPLAENMPGGAAQRPSDVITIYGGKTVEVLNTDAEGRLVLADAIVRATEDDPDLIVDVATLTGAQLVALGTRTSGVMANDDALRDKIVDAAGRAGEETWPMPLPDELRRGLDSAVADIANISSERYAGMLVAGVFLKEFIPEGVHWAHLDIAGPSWHKGAPYGYISRGGTGAATRTLIQIAEDAASGTL